MTRDISVESLVEKVQAYHPQADTDLIERSYAYGETMHTGQMRKSGDPYFTHPISVANIIAEMRLDTASLCAALLHDVVEDTDATTEMMQERFGDEVAFLVDGVTKLGKLNFSSREDRQAESFRKMLIAMARDIRVLLVKLADRLDNMRTLEHMKPDSQERIAAETMEIYAPLAGRLGIHWLKAELEDLSFQYLHRKPYADLASKVERGARDTNLEIDEVSKKLEQMLIARGFALEVAGRKKHLYSVWRKMKRQNIEFEQVHDFVAFRVLMETVADCYAALGVVHSEWTPVPGRFKDYIALPKPNMYQSLHTTVLGPKGRRIEVQIRTREMHRTAEFGIAAHWQYKQASGGVDQRDAAKFAWLRQLMEFQREVDDPAEFFESVKVDLFPDEVYVFTPAGEVKTFPRGATPIDFAFSIHSDVGFHCSGARVNGMMVPLRHKLRNGDVVEILTNRSQEPNKDWLDVVATGRARSRIRAHLRAKERASSAKLGRELLEKGLRKSDISLGRWLKSKNTKEALDHFNLKNVEELFAQVGYGKIGVPRVVEAITPGQAKDRKSLAPSLFERTVRRVTRADDDHIRIDGMDDILVRFGNCCSPIPGDSVIGWITRGRGVTIHRRGCPRSLELDPARRIDVQWATDSKVELPVALRITTTDVPGILAKVSTVFTENGFNINEAACKVGDDGVAVNLFRLSVDDLGRLKGVMRKLADIKGVQEVERV